MKRAGRVWLVVIILASLSSCFVQGAFGEENQHRAVILKVADILKVSPPRITIEYKTQEEMRQWLIDEMYKECARRTPSGIARLQCRVSQDDLNAFVFGRWVKEDDPNHLHIVLWTGASIEVVVHESLHFFLHNTTEPAGMVNDHRIVNPMTMLIITSREFTKWLEDNE